MKILKITTLIIPTLAAFASTIILYSSAFSQNSKSVNSINTLKLFVDNSPSEVVKLDTRIQMMGFIPNQILVKFKDEAVLQPAKEHGFAKAGIQSVDNLLERFQVRNIEKVFKDAQPLSHKQTLKSFSGEIFEQPNLHNIYKLEISDNIEIFQAIEVLTKDPNIEFSEPNYIFSIIDSEPTSDVMTEDDVKQIGLSRQSSFINFPNKVNPDDPLYADQWYIPAVMAPAVWDTTTGDTSSVLAILDTGVDWLHPDLANKIWINFVELNGIPGFDDDGNGFVDDIRGWDFINSDNDPRDDNSHGTHVAGIAAAEANNGIGIAGVNWMAKIMPIKVFQSSGHGDAATISQGILYAANNGATVINMSFGSYTPSQTMENALAFAYSKAVLVGAAGNDGLCIGPVRCSDKRMGKPMFPGALSFVLGVQATNQFGQYAEFSNYDQDGSVYSQYNELYNYELRAPGAGIISTVPNGNYRIYSGTSMAAPVVAGAIALYQTIWPGQSQELMWGNLINATTDNLNLLTAIQISATPQLNFVSHTIIDTLDGDGDGRVDAGETIELWFKVRNTWGHADSVFVGIRFGEFEDTSVAQIIKDTSFLGSIGSYATRSNNHNSLKIHINSNVANNRYVIFEGLIWYTGTTDTIRNAIVFQVENGREFNTGYYPGLTILAPERINLITGNVVFDSLIVLPGTHVAISENTSFFISQYLHAVGKKDSFLTFTRKSGGYWDNVKNLSLEPMIFKYCIFEFGKGKSYSGDNLIQGLATVEDCLFKENSDLLFLYTDCILRKNVFIDNNAPYLIWGTSNIVEYNTVVGNETQYNTNAAIVANTPNNLVKIRNNVAFNNHQSLGNNTSYSFGMANSGWGIYKLPPNYFGTTNRSKIENSILDFFEDTYYPIITGDSALAIPPDSAHGFVWKVLVNGIDPQDENLDPVGPGTHKFEVYFNCSMDTTYVPQLSFGVRAPYTQNFVNDSARWSSDGKNWTAFKTIQLHTGDGINRIRVAEARDDTGFEIPIEDQRFEFVIDAAGSASAGFTASAGLGLVNLEWEHPDLTDILGYNIYRFVNITDTTYTNPVLINNSLILDTLYTDYEVVPNNKYYYYYKVVRTNFTETDSSRIVSAIPFTASRGDANGDLSVNVLDVISIIAYVLGQNPQPFIFDAADVNSDGSINVLDIIGVVSIILGGNKSPEIITNSGNSTIELIGNRIELISDVPIAGIQFTLKGIGVDKLLFNIQGAASQFEAVNGVFGDTARTYIMFNLNGLMLPPGHHVIGIFQKMESNISLVSAILSDANGGNVVTSIWDNGSPLIPTEYYLYQNYPNPFNASTVIQYGLPEKSEVTLSIFNILGQRIRQFNLGEMNAGKHEINWDGRNDNGNIVSSGIYLYKIQTQKFSQIKKAVVIK